MTQFTAERTVLSAMIGAVKSAANELLRQLECERLALRERNDQGIIDSSKAKQQQFEILRSLIGDINKTMRAANVKTAAELFLAHGLVEDWRTANELLEQCDRDNRRNGIIIEAARAMNRRLLELFIGAPSTPAIYGARGKLQYGPLAGPLARA
ncbi:MAG: flagellar export chaperone FlgN [Gammaproteobacteria bacterium]|nr:flagellar export chaperone FlgN [Gammaproteobacteria bacterium]